MESFDEWLNKVENMPEIKFKSDWLKVNNNVHNGDKIEFVNAGEQNDKDQWVFDVKIISENLSSENGAIKKFSLNKGNFEKISSAHGTNSDDWVEKTMNVTTIKVRNPQTGATVDGILLETNEE